MEIVLFHMYMYTLISMIMTEQKKTLPKVLIHGSTLPCHLLIHTAVRHGWSSQPLGKVVQTGPVNLLKK